VNFSNALVPMVIVALLGLGCAKPSFDIKRAQVGMSEDQVFATLGKPSLAIRQGTVSFLEYETFDQDKWFGVGRKENVQRFFVRLVDGRVESFGDKQSLDPVKIPAGWADPDPKPLVLVKPTVDSKPTTEVKPTPAPKPMPEAKPLADQKPDSAPVKPPAAASFDLRSELEKLEKLKKDGLITEVEFKELRQRALDKAKAQ
jgi:outer membrane protein assembly factor BamE (lipoprotein component of BamABCDE complex)